VVTGFVVIGEAARVELVVVVIRYVDVDIGVGIDSEIGAEVELRVSIEVSVDCRVLSVEAFPPAPLPPLSIPMQSSPAQQACSPFAVRKQLEPTGQESRLLLAVVQIHARSTRLKHTSCCAAPMVLRSASLLTARQALVTTPRTGTATCAAWSSTSGCTIVTADSTGRTAVVWVQAQRVSGIAALVSPHEEAIRHVPSTGWVQ
jgi:hypothetical protein